MLHDDEKEEEKETRREKRERRLMSADQHKKDSHQARGMHQSGCDCNVGWDGGKRLSIGESWH